MAITAVWTAVEGGRTAVDTGDRSGPATGSGPAAAAPDERAPSAGDGHDDAERRQSFRRAIASFATGVTVITTTTEDGPAGMTASAVSSLSLNPLLLLVCIAEHLPTRSAIASAGRFAVNVLGEGDEELARRFATPGVDKFAGLAIDHEASVPLIGRAIAHFVCDVHEQLPGGDHTIFIGAVRRCGHFADRRPLLYFGSEFGSLRGKEDHLEDPYLWSGAVRM